LCPCPRHCCATLNNTHLFRVAAQLQVLHIEVALNTQAVQVQSCQLLKADIREFIVSLNPGEFPQLRQLCDSGSCCVVSSIPADSQQRAALWQLQQRRQVGTWLHGLRNVQTLQRWAAVGNGMQVSTMDAELAKA
jgi:hypothetical protein